MTEPAAEPPSTTSDTAAPPSVASTGPAAPRRLEKTTASLPIVHGSVAFYLGKQADEFQTHEWTLYLRGPNNEDLSPVISKVVFQLHASFAQPLREYTQPPYEVTERGWGEFEAQIRIVWKDPLEKATIIPHAIKLYPPGAPVNMVPTDTTTPVVSEEYDEVVFTDPTESFYGQLLRLSSSTSSSPEYSQQKYFGQFSDNDTAQALLEAQKFLAQELTTVKERLLNLDGELAQVDGGLREVQERAKAGRKSTASRAAAVAAATKKAKVAPK